MTRLLFLPLLLLITQVFSQCPTGLKVDLNDFYSTQVYPDLIINQLPSSASLKPYCPKPATQLDNRTSAGWSSAYYAMTILNAIEQNMITKDQITREAFSPTYSQLIVQGVDHVDCDDPISIKESLDVLVGQGVPKFYNYPYFCPDEAKSDLKLHRLSGYYRLFSSYNSKQEILIKTKAMLSQGLPVIIGLKTADSFCDAGEIWNPSNDPMEDAPLHAICIIGYDDDTFGGSFELVNSWGSQWGNKGFIHVPYDDLIARIVEGYVAYQLPDQVEFYFNIKTQLSSGSMMPVELIEQNKYRFLQTYGRGNRFNFIISTNFKGFIYLYYFNDKGESALLFPDQNKMTSEALAFKMSEIIIPSQDRYIQLDANPGIENLIFIMSKEKLNTDQVRLAAQDRYRGLIFAQDQSNVSGIIDVKSPVAAVRLELTHQ